ncbi:Fc.00g077080.m01.CDS01 [Cosmosporella sp. VM-42]
MPREAEPSLAEKTFVTQALEEGLRIDGRKFEEFRPLELRFGDEYGVAEVKFGKTMVLAKVSAEVTVPHSDRPFEGIFTIGSELSPMVAPSVEVNRPSIEEIRLSRLLEKTIRRSAALDTESLCLIAGQKCWSIRVDLHVLSHDGNLTDVGCFAVIAALRHFRKPDTSIEGETVTIYTTAEREPVPLSWLHSPFCVTLNFFGEDGSIAVADTTWLEEQLRVAHCTYSLNKHAELCTVVKMGGCALDAPLFIQCCLIALRKSKEFTAVLDEKLAEDAKRRDKGGLMAELTAENDR